MLLTNKRGHIIGLPKLLPQDVFDILLKSVERIQGTHPPLRLSTTTEQSNDEAVPNNRAAILKLLYILDFNALPQPRYMLRNISDIVKGVNSADEDLRGHSLAHWK